MKMKKERFENDGCGIFFNFDINYSKIICILYNILCGLKLFVRKFLFIL